MKLLQWILCRRLGVSWNRSINKHVTLWVQLLMRQKRDYDLRLESRAYSVGDLVYLLNPAPKVGEAKMLIPICKGPFFISKVLASTLYRIKEKGGLVWCITTGPSLVE